MPKQIDHEAYRRDLAARAAPLFSRHGYSGLGMRQIAQDLGLSKSALYHYFPTKKDLFLACTSVVFGSLSSAPEAKDAPADEQADPATALIALAKALEPGFASELSLLFDYLRDKTADQIADDPAMALANDHLRKEIVARTGATQPDTVLCVLMGALLMRHVSGGRFDYDLIRPLLDKLDI